MGANFGTQPARPPFAWPPAAGPAGGCQQGGRPNAFRRCSPHTAVWDEMSDRDDPSARLCPRVSCFSARHSHQSDIWLPLCCLAMCLRARLISFDFLAPNISQGAQCRQIIAHEQRGLHLEPLLRCSSTQGAAGRNLLRTRMGHAPTFAWDACYGRPLWVTVLIIYN
jgi:hypothetical protein